MRYLLIILSLVSFIICEDAYPYFSDPIKQLKFEEKRIYIKEDKGERTHSRSSGGKTTSRIVLANPVGSIFFGDDPDYVVKTRTTPIETKTNIEKWDEFIITQNNIELSELKLLKVIGLENKFNEIVNNYNILLEERDRKHQIDIQKYEQELLKWKKLEEEYESALFNYNQRKELGELNIIDGTYTHRRGFLTHMFKPWVSDCNSPEECEKIENDRTLDFLLSLGLMALAISDINSDSNSIIHTPGDWFYWVGFMTGWFNLTGALAPSDDDSETWDSKYIEFTGPKYELPPVQPSPILRPLLVEAEYIPPLQENGILSRDQIKSLSESYNKRIYEEIKNSQ